MTKSSFAHTCHLATAPPTWCSRPWEPLVAASQCLHLARCLSLHTPILTLWPEHPCEQQIQHSGLPDSSWSSTYWSFFHFTSTTAGWPSLGLVLGRTTTFKIMNTNISPLETTCHRPAHFVTSPQWQISLTSLEPLPLSGLPLLPPVTRYSHYGKQCGHSSETKK